MLVAMLKVVPILLASAACMGGDEVDSGEIRSNLVAHNKLTANKLTANKLTANKLTANKLTANKLTANRLQLHKSADDLLATPEGREVLSFIISCAINEGVTLVAEYEDEEYEFYGELGLANKWLDHPLGDKGAGWVSACLFSRVNAANVSVPISLRGANQALTVTADERATWTLEEGAFYGDYFTPADEPINWIACRGAAQAAGETGGLIERDCAEPDPANPGFTLCGFTYAGDCGTFAEHHACKKYNEAGTYYERCRSDDIFTNGHKGGSDDHDVYPQAITVFVIP
jgi:hypothetical protein